MVLSNAEIEIEVDRAPICLWAIYLQRADGRKFLRIRIGCRPAERAKARTPLAPGETASLLKYNREDTATPRNNGGGYR